MFFARQTVICVHTQLSDQLPPDLLGSLCRNLYYFTDPAELEPLCHDKHPVLAVPSAVIPVIPEDIFAQNRGRLVEFSDGVRAVSPQSYMALPITISSDLAVRAVETSLSAIRSDLERHTLEHRLNISYEDIRKITEVGQALATEKSFDKLIELIIDRARELVDADGASLYLVERGSKQDTPTHIRFKRSALQLNANEFRLPIDKKSIAGYVALTGEELLLADVHHLPSKTEFIYNSSFDKMHNYHTKSMMVIPMKNHRNDVIGVLQLVNKKRISDMELTLESMQGSGVIPFNENDMEIIRSVAGQAAVAIENNILIDDISNLFEAFVKASVTAIEARDPTTSGHSFRVAEYSISMAEAVNRVARGNFSNIYLSSEQLRELRYASLLHDFGKVGVREHVLVKAKKLYPEQVSNIRWRFQYIRKLFENKMLREKIESMKTLPREAWDSLEQKLEIELDQKNREVEHMLSAILEANEPTILEEGSFDFIQRIAAMQFYLDGEGTKPYIEPVELYSLSIRKGTLDDKERREIESHVTHTFNFLSKIPWTKDLKGIPLIAYGHHEKLDGTGYPLNLEASEISIQTRIMTIADIYDALTAWDRPYKKAMDPLRAVSILEEEKKQGKLDGEILDLFIEKKIYEKVHELKRDQEQFRVI